MARNHQRASKEKLLGGSIHAVAQRGYANILATQMYIEKQKFDVIK